MIFLSSYYLIISLHSPSNIFIIKNIIQNKKAQSTPKYFAHEITDLILNFRNNRVTPKRSPFITIISYNLIFFYIISINEQISNFAQTYPTNLKASSNEALLFMRRYRFANCSCFSCCFKDAYPSSNVQ